MRMLTAPTAGNDHSPRVGPPVELKVANVVVPAQAGTHARWIPAFAGMT